MTTQTTKRIYVLQDEPTGDEQNVARFMNRFTFPVDKADEVFKAMQQGDLESTLEAIGKARGEK